MCTEWLLAWNLRRIGLPSDLNTSLKWSDLRPISCLSSLSHGMSLDVRLVASGWDSAQINRITSLPISNGWNRSTDLAMARYNLDALPHSPFEGFESELPEGAHVQHKGHGWYKIYEETAHNISSPAPEELVSRHLLGWAFGSRRQENDVEIDLCDCGAWLCEGGFYQVYLTLCLLMHWCMQIYKGMCFDLRNLFMTRALESNLSQGKILWHH